MAEQAAQLLPNSAPVLDTLGWVQFQVGAKDRAYATLQRSVDKQELATNTYHLGEVLLDRGQKPLAQRMFTTAKRLAEQTNEPEILEAVKKRLKELGSLEREP